MTREEHLQFCKVCKNNAFDPRQGIVCGLTNRIADFEGSCESFDETDSLLKLDTVANISGREASQGKRFTNYILDIIFIIIFSVILGLFIGLIIGIVAPELVYFFEEDNLLIDYLLRVFFGMLYYVPFEYFTGKSLAKYITKTKVVTESGEKPDFRTIFIRSICRFIPFEPFSFLGSDNRGWHDTISKTYVIEE